MTRGEVGVVRRASTRSVVESRIMDIHYIAKRTRHATKVIYCSVATNFRTMTDISNLCRFDDCVNRIIAARLADELDKGLGDGAPTQALP